MTTTLTPREHDVLHSLRCYIAMWDEAPTRKELGLMLSISRPTVELHLQRMRHKGVLHLVKRLARHHR